MQSNDLKESIRDMSDEDKRYRDSRSGDKHARAQPYKRDKKRVDYADHIETEITDCEID